MVINVVDAGCGVGKTTALINEMNNHNNEQKYIFITPFLDEVDRIKKSCINKNFKEPEMNGSKLNDVTEMIKRGENIVTTHALFKKFNYEMINDIKKHNYVLIMDEVADTIEELPITKSDLDLIIDRYTICDKKTHMLEWIDDSYSGKLNEYKNLINKSNVFAHIGKEKNSEKDKVISIMWMFPYAIFEAFSSVFVLTYMFNSQIQKRYFDYFQSEYKNWYVKNYQLTPNPQIYDYSKNKKLINICENKKWNDIGNGEYTLSISWLNKNKKSQAIDVLKSNVTYFFRKYSTVNDDVLWTTFKEFRDVLKNRGYTKSFAAINIRATNELSHKKNIAYLGNRFLRPTIKNFFYFNNIEVNKEFQDGYALSSLIQFMYRSAIRNGKPINIYVPSERMRNLLKEWIKKPNI